MFPRKLWQVISYRFRHSSLRSQCTNHGHINLTIFYDTSLANQAKIALIIGACDSTDSNFLKQPLDEISIGPQNQTQDSKIRPKHYSEVFPKDLRVLAIFLGSKFPNLILRKICLMHLLYIDLQMLFIQFGSFSTRYKCCGKFPKKLLCLFVRDCRRSLGRMMDNSKRVWEKFDKLCS